ncbi:MAG TPA: LuxR C-terminal-related transcriptional regulator [Chloroflexia bacterium]|nr:LuxR C-terminal-related transcriptional regulator [Chloroflexia bacterium]
MHTTQVRKHRPRKRIYLPQQGRIAGLTRREEEVLSLLADGRSNTEIADTLNITRNTVKSHLTHIYGTLGVHTRTEAAVKWHRALDGRASRVRRYRAG